MILEKEKHLEHYEKNWQDYFGPPDQTWLSSFREQHIRYFLQKGFPTVRDEHWKYTNLSALQTELFDLVPSQEITQKEIIKQFELPERHSRLVFLDGYFQAELSDLEFSEKLIIGNLANAFVLHEMLIKFYLMQQQDMSSFLHLNAACFQDGLFIYIPVHYQIDKPLHLLFLSSKRSMQNVRNIIIAEADSKITLFEEHISLSDDAALTNCVTQLYAKKNATVNHFKLQKQNMFSFHIANMQISQEENSNVNVHSYSLGGKIVREEIHTILREKQASLTLDGLYLPLNKQHIDVQTSVYHLADHTCSEELFKGVIAGKSRGIFNGRIVVGKDVRKAVANLQNKNLLLAKDAEINTKPELEIYSDDVKCKHGATIGQIDKEMLFYLQSRGIAKEMAYQLLLLAFVQSQLNEITHYAIAQRILFTITNYCEENR